MSRINWNQSYEWGDDSALGKLDNASADELRRLVRAILAVAIGLVLGLAGWLALERGDSAITWLAIGGVAIAGAAALLKNFELGLTIFLCICWVSLKTPSVAEGQSGGGGQGIQLSQIGLSALLGLWAVRQMTAGVWGVAKLTVNAPVAAYLFFATLATAISRLFPDPNVARFSTPTPLPVNVLEIVLRVLSLGAMIFLASTLRGKWADRAALAMTISCAASHIGALFLPSSFYMAFPQTLAISVLAGIVLLGVGKPFWRVVAALIVLAILFNLFLKGTVWVSGWVAALIGVGGVVWLLNKKLFAAGVAAVFVIVAVNWRYFYNNFYLENFYAGRQLIQRAASGSTFENDRSRMLAASLRYAEEFPFGIGVGNYRGYNKYYGRKDVWNTTTFTSAHGTYAQTLSESGWAGFLSLLWLLGALLRALWRNWKNAEKVSPLRRAFLVGALCGVFGNIVSSFLGDYLFPAYHNGGMGSFGATVYTWLFAGVALAIGREENLDAPKELVPLKRLAPVIHRPLGSQK